MKNNLNIQNKSNKNIKNNNEKQIKLKENMIKNLETKVAQLTSDLRMTNDLYNQKMSKIKQENNEQIKLISSLKEELEKKSKIIFEIEKLKIEKMDSKNYLDIIEKNKLEISGLSKLNNELSSRNNELNIKNLELSNSQNEIFEENSQLIKTKEELENKIVNLENKIDEMTKSNKEENISNNNNKDFSFEIQKNKDKIKDLEKNIKIKDLAINTIRNELELKNNQISELIIERTNLLNLLNIQKEKSDSDRYEERSKSEKHYSNLKKENNQLLHQITKISDSLGKLYKENQSNKKTISKLNKKINILNDKEYISHSNEIYEKYEDKLKEINNHYKKNEQYLYEQIKELKQLNLEKDEYNKTLQNEFLKLKWELQEQNKNKKI